jgi:hypothetical protein
MQCTTQHIEALTVVCPWGRVAKLAECDDNAEATEEDAEMVGTAAAYDYYAEDEQETNSRHRAEAPTVLTGSPGLGDGSVAPLAPAAIENGPILSSVSVCYLGFWQVYTASTLFEKPRRNCQLAGQKCRDSGHRHGISSCNALTTCCLRHL